MCLEEVVARADRETTEEVCRRQQAEAGSQLDVGVERQLLPVRGQANGNANAEVQRAASRQHARIGAVRINGRADLQATADVSEKLQQIGSAPELNELPLEVDPTADATPRENAAEAGGDARAAAQIVFCG